MTSPRFEYVGAQQAACYRQIVETEERRRRQFLRTLSGDQKKAWLASRGEKPSTQPMTETPPYTPSSAMSTVTASTCSRRSATKAIPLSSQLPESASSSSHLRLGLDPAHDGDDVGPAASVAPSSSVFSRGSSSFAPSAVRLPALPLQSLQKKTPSSVSPSQGTTSSLGRCKTTSNRTTSSVQQKLTQLNEKLERMEQRIGEQAVEEHNVSKSVQELKELVLSLAKAKQPTDLKQRSAKP